MKGHASYQTLTQMLTGALTTRKNELVKSHIQTCATCKATYDFINKINAPALTKAVKPAHHVRKNIISFYDKTAAENKKESSSATSMTRMPRYRLAAAAAVVVAGCIAYGIYSHLKFENAPIKASKVRGFVKVDTNKLIKGQQLHPGVLLTTGEDSKLSIMYGKIMKLIAGPHTSIYITKSHRDKQTGKIFFEMVIDKGNILAVFDKAGNLEYTLITPHGKISSSGSNIAMKVDPSKTQVVVKNGSANLSSIEGYSVNSEEGSGYSITNKSVTSAMETAEDEVNDSANLYDNTENDLLDDDPNDDEVVAE